MIRFLNSLLNVFGWQKRKIEPYSKIRRNENITRYLFQSNLFSRNPPPGKSRVKHAAFSLGKYSKVSIYRTDGLSETEIFDIGDTHVASATGKPIKAWAVLKAKTILENNLTIEPDGVPHPRHANIAKWPTEREKQLMLRTKLANEAELFIANTNHT